MHIKEYRLKYDEVWGLIFEGLRCRSDSMLEPCLYSRFIFDDLSERLYDRALGHGVDVQRQSDTGV